jgi:predicted Zn-dependent peptidase
MVAHPLIDSAGLDAVKREMGQALGMASGSTYQNCRNNFYNIMFGEDHPFSKVPLGTMRTVMSITIDELKAYHKRFYAPNNMIMTVCTNLDSEWVSKNIKASFGQLQPAPLGNITVTAPEPPSGVVQSNIPMEKEQIYIYLGTPVIGISHEDFPALKVASDILSTRLGQQLRETQGLAYSVGAGVATAPDFGWFLVTMGTGKENYQTAHNGIINVIKSMTSEPPSEQELRKAKNSIWGSSLSRRLSRINQAYYLTLYEFFGTGYDYGEEYINKIRSVTIDDVLYVAEKYLPVDNYYLSTVGL